MIFHAIAFYAKDMRGKILIYDMSEIFSRDAQPRPLMPSMPIVNGSVNNSADIFAPCHLAFRQA